MRIQAVYDKNLVILDYLSDNFTLPEIAKKHNISIQTVYDILFRENIPRKRKDNIKNIFNYNYFDVVDSKDKAYFLGWLYSDGNNYTPTGTIQLKIKQYDKNILEILSMYISNGALKIKDVFRKDENTQSLLIFTSNYTSKKLEDLGCMRKKTFLLKFPTLEQVPKHLQSHFIRGYFDGDGCISKTLKGSLMFTICGGINVLTGIQNILIKQCLLNKTKLIKNKSIFNLCYGGNLQVKRIYEWLYKDCDNLYLKRKKEKFE